MKKYMNFLGEGISPDFLHAIRRVSTRKEFFDVCRNALDHGEPMPLVGTASPSCGRSPVK